MMSKAIGITKEAVSKDWTDADRGFSFVDIQFVMTDDKEFVDIFLDKLDGFVNSCNKAIKQSHYDDEPINTDELIGYILRKTGDDYHLDYEEVQAVLDSELEFLKSKGLTEECEDTGIYLNEGWLSDEIICVDIEGVGTLHNTGHESITLDEEVITLDEGMLVYRTRSFIDRGIYSRARNSIVDNKEHVFRVAYRDTLPTFGKLLFTSIESDKFVMEICSQY